MKCLAVAALAGALTMGVRSETVSEMTTPETYTAASGETLRYRLYLPKPADPKQKLPIVLFLHGAGERGTNNVSQLLHGIPSLIRYGKESGDPAILIIPQCPTGGLWASVARGAPSQTKPDEPAAPLRLALAVLRARIEALPVDRDRVYVTGVSMGGFGTWDAIQREPELFAAAIPICGGGDVAMAPKLRHLPVWVFHGEKDTIIPASRSRDMVAALQAAGGNVQYREYPGMPHNVWTKTYDDFEVLKWLFTQRRNAPPQ